MSATPYVETEILLAIMEDNEERAFDLLVDMHAHELREFARQVDQLMHLIRRHPR